MNLGHAKLKNLYTVNLNARDMIYLLILLCLALRPSLSQIVASPTFSFERLSFGDSIEDVRKKLAQKQLHNGPSSTNPFLPNENNFISFVYDDTCFGKWFGISLSFSKRDNRLSLISAAFTGTIPTSGGNYPGIDSLVGQLRDQFSARYGKPNKKRVSVMGEEQVWTKSKTTIRMLKSTSPKPFLLISFEPSKIPE